MNCTHLIMKVESWSKMEKSKWFQREHGLSIDCCFRDYLTLCTTLVSRISKPPSALRSGVLHHSLCSSCFLQLSHETRLLSRCGIFFDNPALRCLINSFVYCRDERLCFIDCTFGNVCFKCLYCIMERSFTSNVKHALSLRCSDCLFCSFCYCHM